MFYHCSVFCESRAIIPNEMFDVGKNKVLKFNGCTYVDFLLVISCSVKICVWFEHIHVIISQIRKKFRKNSNNSNIMSKLNFL